MTSDKSTQNRTHEMRAEMVGWNIHCDDRNPLKPQETFETHKENVVRLPSRRAGKEQEWEGATKRQRKKKNSVGNSAPLIARLPLFSPLHGPNLSLPPSRTLHVSQKPKRNKNKKKQKKWRAPSSLLLFLAEVSRIVAFVILCVTVGDLWYRLEQFHRHGVVPLRLTRAGYCIPACKPFM